MSDNSTPKSATADQLVPGSSRPTLIDSEVAEQ